MAHPVLLHCFHPQILQLKTSALPKYVCERSTILLHTSAISKGASSWESSSMVQDLKKSAMRAVANTKRGKATTYGQRKQILKLIEELERQNFISDPADSPLLSGFWSLLYTAPINEETADKFVGTEEGPFLSRIKPLFFGSVQQKRSTQVIDTSSGIVKNIAAFSFFGLDGTLSINGTAVRPLSSVTRLDVTFDSFIVKLGGWTSPTVSLKLIDPKGWVETTYLDEDLRIGRGDKGSIFIAARAKENECDGNLW